MENLLPSPDIVFLLGTNRLLRTRRIQLYASRFTFHFTDSTNMLAFRQGWIPQDQHLRRRCHMSG